MSEMENRQPHALVVQIDNEVLSEIAALAACQVPGVAELASGLTSGLPEFMNRRSSTRGVRIEMQERRVEVSLNLMVEYGVRIPELAQRVQETVKSAIEESTGLPVGRVDIHIQSIRLPSSSVPPHN